jgi:hypothetical protein
MVFVVCAAGCMHPVAIVAEKERIDYPAQGILGYHLGYTPPMSPAVGGVGESRYRAGTVMDIEVGYQFRGRLRWLSNYGVARHSLELRILEHILPLDRDGDLFWGKAQILYVIPTYRISFMPGEGGVVGAHVDFGGGGGLPIIFESGDMKRDDALTGVNNDIAAGAFGIVSLGFGMDFFVADNTSISVGARIGTGSGKFQWKQDDVPLDGIGRMYVTNIYLTVGVRFQF